MKTKVLLFPFIILLGVYFLINKKTTNYSEFLKTEYKKIKSFDKPDISGFRDFLMTQDPELQRVPLERLPRAFKAKQNTSQLKSANSLNWNNTETTMGGRTRDLMYDPTDATHKKVWACSVTGGLWYNTDITNSATQWQPVSDNWISMATTNICYDPNNTSTFYVGTGEPETAIHIYRESSGRGVGVYKTTDAGQTWALLPSTSGFTYVSDIEVRNENGTSVIYCAVMSGEYKGGTFQATPTDGLYRSADDGSTWTQVLPNIAGETVPYAPSDIEIADNGTIYIGTTSNLNGDGAACILQSTTGLAGSWSVNTDYRNAILADTEFNIPGRVELSASKTDPATVYAIIGGGSNTELVENFGTFKGKYIVKTTNSGATWNYINMPDDDNSGRNWAYLSWHAFTVQVSPDDADVVYIGGLDIHKTVNGGASWIKVSDWVLMYYGGGDEFVHGDIHHIAYNPAITDEFIVSTDGGVFYTSSANSTPVFVPKNNAYNTFQFYSCGVSYQAADNRYTGGLQDNGTFYYSGHPYELNDMVQGGDGAFTIWDKNDDSFISSTYDNSMVMFYDGGYTQINDYTCGTFISPFDFDSDDKVIYSNAITFTGDYSDQIFKVTGLPTTHNDEFVNVNTGTQTPFSAVRYTKTNANIHTLLVGNYTGEIFKINNINAVPNTSQIDNGQLPNAYVSCIQTSKNADTILVTLSNYGVQSVWQTFNGGGVWTDISGNLPDMPIRWAIYHPQNKKQIMLATETGIWITDNAQATNVVWTAENNFPNVRVDMLSIRPADNFLVVATHGRGMYTSTWDFVSNVKEVKSVINNNDLVVYPNPTKDFINLKLIKSDIVNVKLYSSNGVLINEFLNPNLIDVSGYKQGQYIIKVTDNTNGVYTKTFIKN